jgi:prevent-host-death family protein
MLQTMTAMSLAEAKAHLSDVLSRVGKQHERVTATVRGHLSATLRSPEDLARREETWLSSPTTS